MITPASQKQLSVQAHFTSSLSTFPFPPLPFPSVECQPLTAVVVVDMVVVIVVVVCCRLLLFVVVCCRCCCNVLQLMQTPAYAPGF